MTAKQTRPVARTRISRRLQTGKTETGLQPASNIHCRVCCLACQAMGSFLGPICIRNICEKIPGCSC